MVSERSECLKRSIIRHHIVISDDLYAIIAVDDVITEKIVSSVFLLFTMIFRNVDKG